MISPMTPPGTKVVALKSWHSPFLPTHIIKGHVYTVAEIKRANFGVETQGEFAVFLQELPHKAGEYTELPLMVWAFPLHCFRRLDLPKVLTETLDREKSPADLVKEIERV